MEKLFSEFTGVTSAQWKEQIIKDLKGIDFNQLVSKSHNGFDINPFYTYEDLKEKKEPLFTNSDWDICEQIMVWDEKEANHRALKALEGGASGLSFFINKKINTSALLKDISLKHIYSQFNITNDALHVLEDLKEHYGKVNEHDGKIKCFVNLDPLHLFAFYGEWHDDETKDLSVLNKLQHIPVNVGLYEDAGASTVNELAIGLAHVNEYFNYLSEQNNLKDRSLHCSFSVAPDFFTEIAKFRAFRKLIALLQEQYKTNFPIHIHAQTTMADKSSLDIYNNMLRTTTEAMSAVIGGANSLSVLPFNEGFEKTSDFSSRISRNQQHILKDESYLNKVADISAGSYYIESITDSIAEKSWEQFKVIESKGGFIACLKNNFIQGLIAQGANELQKEFKEGKLILVGVNKYENPEDSVRSKEFGDVSKSERKPDIKSIKPIRLAILIENQKTSPNSELFTPN
ncbi:MAG TPA: methylmalonyl-CoA mutase family protein [Bacteroidia bacterium]|jgi:methylmalonyl-CoA mutase|nr:methylmalonyl-CoA mutase family protein [Bacteroidia bacterium]